MMASRHSTGMADFFKLSYMPAGAGKHAGQLPKISGHLRAQCKCLVLETALGQLPKSLGSCPCGCMGLLGQLPMYHT